MTVPGGRCDFSIEVNGPQVNQPRAIETTRQRIPLAAWLSLLSLDAVLVAVAWQQLLMQSFCHRWSTLPETGSLVLTVWLVYVADRLLDAARLDLSQPHTLRHQFYHRHGRIFFVAWVTVLLLDTFIVVRYLSPELLRSGLILAAAVLIYGAGVHFPGPASDPRHRDSGRRSRWPSLPKEFRVGTLFALGVSLTAWTHLVVDTEGVRGPVSLWPLAMTTFAMAILFCVNCVLVARFERHLDQAQSFASIATQNTSFDAREMRWSPRVLAIVVAMPLAALTYQLPTAVGIAIGGCAAGLLTIVAFWDRPMPHRDNRATLTVFDIRGVWVDAVLWTPPAVILCCL
ncbi:hypothetical protein [Aporhodopirellula aestuarii]|uniref:Uncharacterized protein n=1 Tax=Aporhodopirellula aestuarii TaxID=2950107 RepID=A0ABT0U5A1_9BACT|nr:hypothetical protein [Aporhodopirellula aestuarii]MCM2371740.1 hypothetical protein [Aporhodopirellula aestuarii]